MVEIKIGDKFIHSRRVVEILALPDKRHKVAVRYLDTGDLSVVRVDRLELQEELRCRFWIMNGQLMIQSIDINSQKQIAIPGSQVLKLFDYLRANLAIFMSEKPTAGQVTLVDGPADRLADNRHCGIPETGN